MLRKYLPFIAPLALAVAALVGLSGVSWAVQKESCTKSVLCSGLIAVFDFEEASDYAREASNSYARLFEAAGANVGTAAGKLGANAASFAGTDTSRLELLNGGIFGNGAWTVSVWIYPTSTLTNQSIINQSYTNDMGPRFRLVYTGGFHYPQLIVFKESDGASVLLWNSAATTQRLTINAWNHVAFGVTYFIDGTATYFCSVNNQTLYTQSMPAYMHLNAWDTYIGANVQGSENFTGRLDQLVVVGRAWRQGEISLMYNAGAGRAYPFDTGN